MHGILNYAACIAPEEHLLRNAAARGFTSTSISIHWAIITLATAGYGAIVPVINLGQALVSVTIIIGYSIIAVLTGIVTSDITFASKNINGKVCQNCSFEGHDSDAKFCKRCGAKSV